MAVTAPVAVQRLMMLTPDDGTQVTATGLEAGGSADMGQGKMKFFKTANVTAGQQMKLTLSGLTAAQAGPGANAGGMDLPKAVALTGGLMVFVVGGFLLFHPSGAEERTGREVCQEMIVAWASRPCTAGL